MLCFREFSKILELELHLQVHNTTTNPATKSDALREHVKAHKNQFRHQCNICNETFLRKDAYDTHIKKQTGSRPYQFEACKKSFNVRSSLPCCSGSKVSKTYSCQYGEKKFSREEIM